MPRILVLTSHIFLSLDVRLSASPGAAANAQLSAHLKPSFEFGLSLAGQTAGLYLELDTFAALNLSLTSAASGSVSTDSSNSTNADAGGCVDISTGLSVNAGADADLLGLFSVDDKVVLYDKEFELYKTCFGNGSVNQQTQGQNQNQKRDSSQAYVPAWGSGRRVPLSLFEQNLRKDHDRVGPQGVVADAAVKASSAPSAPAKSGKGFSCPVSPGGGRVPIVAQKVNATR